MCWVVVSQGLEPSEERISVWDLVFRNWLPAVQGLRPEPSQQMLLPPVQGKARVKEAKGPRDLRVSFCLSFV